jgi:hypothetical protein
VKKFTAHAKRFVLRSVETDVAARLAAAATDPLTRDGYSRIAREQMAKANEAEAVAGHKSHRTARPAVAKDDDP